MVFTLNLVFTSFFYFIVLIFFVDCSLAHLLVCNCIALFQWYLQVLYCFENGWRIVFVLYHVCHFTYFFLILVLYLPLSFLQGLISLLFQFFQLLSSAESAFCIFLSYSQFSNCSVETIRSFHVFLESPDFLD